MCQKVSLLIVILLFSSSPLAWGKAYVWTDDEGVQYATDREETIPPKYRDKLKIILNPTNRRYVPDDPQKKTVVNFSRGSRTIIIPGVLNETYSVKFFLDTGSTDVLITEEDSRALGLDLSETPRVKIKLADGNFVEAPRVILDSIKIGNAEAKNIPVVIGKVRLLGLSFLNNFGVVIDLEKGHISFSE
jgi:clan AA aspartic protease (TIGR02281 family)